MKPLSTLHSLQLSWLVLAFAAMALPAWLPGQALLSPYSQPKFVNQLPNALNPSFIFDPVNAPNYEYEIGVYPFSQNLGLVGPWGNPLTTNLYGYGAPGQAPTFPGRTIVAHKDDPIRVKWRNELKDWSGNPLTAHLLPIDPSLHWVLAMPGYSLDMLGQYGIPIVPHLHGGHTESDSDGNPEYWWTPGESWERLEGPRFVKDIYTYDNDQPAGTLWYHDHGLGITRLNVYAGMAGFYILRDDYDTGEADNPAGLPAFPYEVPIVIQDRQFTSSGQLYYPAPLFNPGTGNIPSVQPEFFGDFILVNGMAWPVQDVEPRLYRYRVLNGSDSRFYELYLSNNEPIHVIGTDDALRSGPPATVDRLVIGPGERYDVLIDFSGFAGQTIIMKNTARSPYPKGAPPNPQTAGQIMAFRVGATVTDNRNNTLPTWLSNPNNPAPISTWSAAKTRKLLLFEGEDGHGRLQPMLGVVGETGDIDGNTVDGTLLWDEHHYPITEFPKLNTVEIWEIYNATADAHPIHLHLVSFNLLGRQKFKASITPKVMTAHDGTTSIGGALTNVRKIGGLKPPEAYERGWKDTGLVYPGETARYIAKFDRLGRYVWHCHILSHEDHEMMRPYEVVPQGYGLKAPAIVTEAPPFRVAPNPFSAATRVDFSLSEADRVTLRIVDLQGRLVRELENRHFPAGDYDSRWDGTDAGGNAVPAGVYLAVLRFESAETETVQKLILER